jgi:hypothetical protein
LAVHQDLDLISADLCAEWAAFSVAGGRRARDQTQKHGHQARDVNPRIPVLLLHDEPPERLERRRQPERSVLKVQKW